MTQRAARAPGWGWVARCRVLGGNPTREMFDEAVAAGQSALPLMVDVLSRREFREGEPTECAPVPVHAMRVLGEVGSAAAIPSLVNVLTDSVDPALYGEEAALALARLGDAAVPAVEGVLRGLERDTWVRVSAARALMFAALVDRRRRARVQATYERMLLDPRETDRMFVAHVVLNSCLMAAPYLLPAIDVAFESGRVDTDVVELDSVRMEMICRHHRPDAETKDLARRDVREDYLTWEELVSGLAVEDRERIERLLARIDRLDIGPPREGDEAYLWAGELGYPADGESAPDDDIEDDDD